MHLIIELLQQLVALLGVEFPLQFLQSKRDNVVVVGAGEFWIAGGNELNTALGITLLAARPPKSYTPP